MIKCFYQNKKSKEISVDQGSKNWPSPIRLGRVVTASVLTESIPAPDTSVCFESVEFGINRLNSVNSTEFPR